MYPKLNILARGHNVDHCKRLKTKGACITVSENLEASVALAQAALSLVNSDQGGNDAAIEQYRKHYYSDEQGKL